ncbi:MAG: YHS domain-containing protein [Bryobacteraceae bacterium]
MLLFFSAAVMAGGLAAIAPSVSLANQKKTEARQVKDPVCSMMVDPKTAEKAVYKGKSYYFCSREEKEQFEKSPEKYAGQVEKK